MKPEKVFRIGPVSGSVFVNEVQTDGGKRTIRNVNLQRRQSAVMGIFAVQVSGIGDQPLKGVASVGTRPTFDGVKPLLEVHLFDFDGDIYGEYIHVDFVARLREERKFDSADALIDQMHIDSRQAREILAA